MSKTKKAERTALGAESFDLEAAVKRDLSSACALLHVVLDNPKLLSMVSETIKEDLKKRESAAAAGVPNVDGHGSNQS